MFEASTRQTLLGCICLAFVLGCSEISTEAPPSHVDIQTELQTILESDLKGVVPGSYIVVLRNDGADVRARADDLLRGSGAVRGRVWQRAIRGFSASNLSEERAAALARDSRVRRIEPNRFGGGVSTYRQLVSENGTYVGASQWALDRIDHYGSAQFDGQFTYTHTGSGQPLPRVSRIRRKNLLGKEAVNYRNLATLIHR
jgi:hypothetical protein